MKRSIIVILTIAILVTFTATSLGFTSVAVRSIKLSSADVIIQAGKTYTLKVTITPANATNKKMTFLSGNKSIATVDTNGKIKGIKPGKTVITVTSASNNKAAAKCNVTVSQTATGSGGNSNFNKTGFPIVKKKVTFKALVGNSPSNPPDFNQLKIIQEAEKLTNIKIVWSMAGSGLAEKKSLMLASNNLPDFFVRSVTDAELVKYGAEKVFIPTQKLINDYAPNIKALFTEIKDLDKYMTAPDGNMYGIPRVFGLVGNSNNGHLAINKKWLDKMGLQLPTTIDQLEETLKKFKSGDPNGNGKADEIPFSFGTVGGSSATVSSFIGFSQIFASFGIGMPAGLADVRNGKVLMNATLPEYKDAINYLNKLYKQGLIDIDGFTQTRQQYDAKLAQQPSIIGFGQIYSLGDELTAGARADWVYLPLLKGPGGKEPVSYTTPFFGITRGNAVITSACKNPEALIRWLDYLYTPEISMQICYGEIGKNVIKAPDARYTLTKDIPAGKTGTQYKDEQAMGGYGTFGLSYRWIEKNFLDEGAAERHKFMKESKFYDQNDKDPMPPLFLNTQESDAVNPIYAELVKFIDRRSCEWIMNGNADKEWDAFLKELDKIGYQKWLEVNQVAYQRFMKK